jgi:hypothetical protein
MAIKYLAPSNEASVVTEHNVYWRGALDGKLCSILVDDEEDPIEARRLVKMEHHETNEAVHGAVLVSIKGGKA